MSDKGVQTESNGNSADDNRPAPIAETQKLSIERGDVGEALRSAFQATVEEDVPQDLLDLLRRLD